MSLETENESSQGVLPTPIRAGVDRVSSVVARYFRPENWVLVRLTQVVILYIVWFSLGFVFPEDLMPMPMETFNTLYEMTVVDGVVVEAVWITLRRVLIAFAITFAIGLGVGVLMGLKEFWEDFILPYLIIVMMIPGILWAVAILLTFGFGDTTAIAIAVFGPSALTSIQVWKGTKNIDYDLVEMASSFNVSRLRLLRRVIIPNIAPELFAVARFGLGLAFKIMLVAELLATSDGMGAKIYQTYSSYQYQETFGWVVVIALLIATLEIGLRRLENRVFAYREDSGLEALGA